MTTIEDKPSLDEAMAHFGVKGMHWGVRKSTDSATGSTGQTKKPMSAERKKAIAKKAAIGAGILILAAGTAYVAYSMNKNGKLPTKGLSGSATSKGKTATEAIFKEPTSILHVARGKNVGFRFLKEGGIPSTMITEYDKSGLGEGSQHAGEVFQKYGAAGAEKIAARIIDPQGRKDHASRAIKHDIIIPASMTNGIHNLADVKEKIWPLLSTDYDASYLAMPKGF